MRNTSFFSNNHFYLLLIFLFLFSSSFAQDRGIFEIGKTTNKSTSKSKSKSVEKNNRDDFYELAFKLHPTIYLEKNKISKINDEKHDPVKIKLNGSDSFSKLNNLNSKANKVELIYITLNNFSELNTVLDLDSLKGFNHLKYIYIKCLFKCNSNDIKNFIKNNSSARYRIFYKIEIPS